MIAFTFKAHSQNQNTTHVIEYKGGDTSLIKQIFKYIGKHSGFYDGKEREHNRYFQAVVEIEKDGTIGDQINIVMIDNDTSAMSETIIDAIKQTNGHWINHTHEEQSVVLPIYFIYKKDETSMNVKPDIKQEYHYKSQKINLIYLAPIIIQMEPPIN
jgi:hypothetical protein